MLIYVSGPYGADTEAGKLANTEIAINVGLELMKKGHTVIIPHLSHYVDMMAIKRGIDIPWEKWMEQDLDILERCDVLYFIGSSRGADIELEHALDFGLEVYRSLGEVPCCEEG